MWRYSGSNRPKVVLYFVLFVFAGIIASADPLIVGVLFNTIQQQGVNAGNFAYILLLLLLFPARSLFFWAFHGVARVLENTNAFIVRANYRKYLLKGVMALPIEWHTDHHSGDTIDKIEKGTDALFDFSESTFVVLKEFLTLIISFGALFYFDYKTALLSILLLIIAVTALLLFDKKLIPGYVAVNRLENQVSAKVFDSLSNVVTVIILRIEKLVLKSISEFIEKPFQQFIRNSKINESKWFTSSFLGRFTVMIILGFYLYAHVGEGTVLAGTVYILYEYANRASDTFDSFAYLYGKIIRQRTSVANSEELSKEFRDVTDTAEMRLPKDWKELKIAGLGFSYHAESKVEGVQAVDLHIDDINVVVKRGERIALIGESGGGKSTFLKLIRDLYHPKSLNLSVDGRALGHSFASIRDSIALVPQDPEIFATTVRENITLGVDYTDMHIGVFTDMAAFSEVVKRLPKGLESSVVEKGVNLSGGEKQRLALTRGLLASVDKDIVLLDEPTSSVDLNNEITIYKNIFEAFAGKTIISSVHRLHLLSSFDTIFFFKDGRIIASGSFDELQQSSPDFQVLWKKYIEARDNGVA